MFPLFLNLTDRLALVVGGGPVGRRKAHALLAAGARVRLVCLKPRPAEESSDRLDWQSHAYQSADLDGVSLAVAAANAEVNRQVVADARAGGVWVCDAVAAQQGDFTFPAVVRRGDFVIAVGTGGAAPGLARRVRERLEADFDAAFGEWVEVLAVLRSVARVRIPDRNRRRAFLEAASDWPWLERLRREGRERVWADLVAELGEWSAKDG
jgi:precorrin-2 dehydrogenase/sirohydrochlorin ferrochelatase